MDRIIDASFAFTVVVCTMSCLGCDSSRDEFPQQQLEPPQARLNLELLPKASRRDDGLILVEAIEKKGAGQDVLSASNLVIDSVLDADGQPARFRLRSYQMARSSNSGQDPENLVLQFFIDSSVRESMAVIEGVAELRVGASERVSLPLEPESVNSLTNAKLQEAEIMASGWYGTEVGLMFEGADAANIKVIKLSSGPSKRNPNVISKSDFDQKFVWERVDDLTAETEFQVWLDGSDPLEEPDWTFDPNQFTEIQHPSLDIKGTYLSQPIWELLVSGSKNNLISAQVVDAAGETVGARPDYRSESDRLMISLSATGSNVRLEIELSLDGKPVLYPFRFENVPIE